MRAKRIVLFSLTILFFPLLAHGASVILPSQDKMIENAAVIAKVTVESIKSYEKDKRIYTRIALKANEGIKGANAGDVLIVTERGGRLGERTEWIPGNPTYKVGEQAIVLLDKKGQLSLRTAQMDLGKLPMPREADSATAGETDPIAAWKRALSQKIKELPVKPDSITKRAAIVSQAQAEMIPSPAMATQSLQEFNFMGGKWRTPGSVYGDPVGDSKLGPQSSIDVVKKSYLPWTATANGLKLSYGGESQPQGFICEPGKLLVSFNDPNDEIDDPSNCGGVLAIGGFCAGPVGSDGFAEINGAAIVFNNGWSDCNFWIENNVLEVAAHESGHAVGLAHSCEQSTSNCSQDKQNALMYWMAHFDGRGNTLTSYDQGAIVALYGNAPTASPTMTASPTPVATASPTATEVPGPSPTAKPGGCGGGGSTGMGILGLTILGVLYRSRRG